jgi:hypothetical protein
MEARFQNPAGTTFICFGLIHFRYLDFVAEWTERCKQAKEDHVNDHDCVLFEMKRELYGFSTKEWWCGCESYQHSPYHLCKHLVQEYIGTEGLQSNKPPMPFYGEVWRQTTAPVLWVKKFHYHSENLDFGLLKTRDLRLNSEPPILLTNDERRRLQDMLKETDPSGPEREVDENPLEVLRDSSDEEDVEDDDMDEGGLAGEIMVVEIDRDEHRRRIEEAERVFEDIHLLQKRWEGLNKTLEELKKYPPGHRHLREAPNFRGPVEILFTWSERRQRSENARVLPPTFGDERRGIIFK